MDDKRLAEQLRNINGGQGLAKVQIIAREAAAALTRLSAERDAARASADSVHLTASNQASEINRLSAENADLRKALESIVDDSSINSVCGWYDVIEAGRRALASAGQGGGG